VRETYGEARSDSEDEKSTDGGDMGPFKGDNMVLKNAAMRKNQYLREAGILE
jgi:hypothetical protein